MNEEPKQNGEDRAKRAMEKLLRQAKDTCFTGDAYIRLRINQGGVKDAKIALEGTVE